MCCIRKTRLIPIPNRDRQNTFLLEIFHMISFSLKETSFCDVCPLKYSEHQMEIGVTLCPFKDENEGRHDIFISMFILESKAKH